MDLSGPSIDVKLKEKKERKKRRPPEPFATQAISHNDRRVVDVWIGHPWDLEKVIFSTKKSSCPTRQKPVACGE